MEAKYTPECITLLEQSKETAKTFGGGGIKPEHIFYTLLTKGVDYDASRMRLDIIRPADGKQVA